MEDINPLRPKYHLEMLSADELVSIQSATLQLLENVGLRFPSEIVLELASIIPTISK
jgi:trimethylamine:corrinoid methyltransferase-like protein